MPPIDDPPPSLEDARGAYWRARIDSQFSACVIGRRDANGRISTFIPRVSRFTNETCRSVQKMPVDTFRKAATRCIQIAKNNGAAIADDRWWRYFGERC